MTTHCVSYYEEPNAEEMVDIAYQCSAACMRSTLERDSGVTGVEQAGTMNVVEGGSVSWGGCPGGNETDHDAYCSNCGKLLWHGLLKL